MRCGVMAASKNSFSTYIFATLFISTTYYFRRIKLAHLSSHEAFENLKNAKKDLAQAKKDKADSATIQKLQKAVNNAQLIANQF